jgi:hypothetical protein
VGARLKVTGILAKVALSLSLLAMAERASSQTVNRSPFGAPTTQSLADIDREIEMYKLMLQRIDDGWIHTGLELISPVQRPSLHSHRLELTPNQVAEEERVMERLTRQLRSEFERSLADLRRQRARGGVIATTPADTLIRGTWRLGCYIDGRAAVQRGSFAFTTEGDGRVEAEFTDALGDVFIAPGDLEVDQASSGCGAHPLGTFCWSGSIVLENGVWRLKEGVPRMEATNSTTSCTYGEMVQELVQK